MHRAIYEALLKDLQRLQRLLVTASIQAARQDERLWARLVAQHAAAEVGGGVDEFVASAARRSTVLFLLRVVFVRVLEDLGLLSPPRVRGEVGHTFFRELFPALNHRAYFGAVFRDLAHDLPALFTPGEDELPLPPQDECERVWALWHAPNKDGVEYRWDGDTFDSHFLGDLYQDLDADIRKHYALLQTPPFVEAFLLRHTLTPALVAFPPEALAEGETFRLLDPTCGSGHFLIGAFHALADRAQAHGASDEQAIHLALASVWGCDINPHAVGIAQFRLLLEAHRRRPSLPFEALCTLPFNVAALDSLIPWEGVGQGELFFGRDRLSQYATPQERAQNAAFLGRAFHVVVGNPPYITPKDVQKRDDYRHFWPDSAGGKYALSAPFVERLLRLAAPGGFVGQITANSFMKREFGRGLVTRVLPRWDLTAVIDTSGAYIPGHGTPTVILLARAQAPVKDEVWTLLGKRGEPKRPVDPADGLVWRAIEEAGQHANDSNPFITVAWMARSILEQHPWSLGGGEASDIVKTIESTSGRLGAVGSDFGYSFQTNADPVFMVTNDALRRLGIPAQYSREVSVGDAVRDYSLPRLDSVIYPYDEHLSLLASVDGTSIGELLWPFKTVLFDRATFSGGTYRSDGKPWFQWHQFAAKKHESTHSLVFAFVATHNHFVLDRGGKVFNRTSPVVKLPRNATEDDHLDLLGLLNSSSLGFWMKQTFFNKGSQGVGEGIKSEEWERFYEYDSTKLQQAPLTTADRPARIALARALDAAARARSATLPAAVLGASDWTAQTLPLRLAAAREEHARFTATMVALQEELDWLTYGSYGLCAVATVGPEDVTPLRPGERPFEVAAARREDAGEVEERSAWWTRHHHLRVTEPPALPPAAAERYLERLTHIAADPRIALLEGMAFKRRWQTPDLTEGGEETRRAAESWLYDSLEGLFDGGPLSEPRPVRLEELVALWTRDPRVLAVLALAAPQDPPGVVAERLLQRAGLPENPHRLYTEEGWRKHLAWRRVWALQALEDAGQPLVDPDAPGVVLPSVPLPPKFERGDFQRAEHFAQRGKLNVPRERFVLYTELSPTRYGWAGWRGLARSQAQVEALAMAERDPVRPQPRPSPERPERCGVAFGLWESLPSLSRLAGAEAAEEFTAVAQDACGQRACPCPLLDAWRAQSAAAPRKGRAKAAPVVPAVIEVEAPPVTVAERAALLNLLGPRPMTEAALLQSLRAQLGVQLNLLAPPPLTEARLPLVIDALVAKGELERAGRGQRRTVKVKAPGGGEG